MLDNNDLENYEFAREFGRQVEKMRANFEGIYIINPENYRRFVDIYTYFRIFAEENDGKVTHLDISPESIHAGLIINLPMIDLQKQELVEFLGFLSKADVLGIESDLTDGISIDITVSYVWKAVPKE